MLIFIEHFYYCPGGPPTSEEISLYRKELLAIHFNCKTRPAVGLVRGTEICIPNTFPSPEVSIVLGEL